MVAAALMVVGVTLGTLSDNSNARVPARSGDFWVLTGDFHVHAFPGDGGLPIWELRREAQRRGLDVIALTNHNHRVAQRIAAPFLPKPGFPIVIDGQEVTARAYHIAAVGVRHEIDARGSAAEAIAAIHDQGGAAIAAHPSRDFWAGFDDAALSMLDGAELAYPEDTKLEVGQEFVAFYQRVRALNPRIGAIGSSDFHFQSPLGLCRTFVLAREPSAAGVIAALREGRAVAYDDRGNLFGEPALVNVVEQHLESAPAAERGTEAAQRLSVVSVLAGLLLFIMVGRPAETSAKS